MIARCFPSALSPLNGGGGVGAREQERGKREENEGEGCGENVCGGN